MSFSLTLAADNPVAHVINHAWWISEDGTWLWSSAQTNLVLSGLIVCIAGLVIGKAVMTGEEAEGHARYTTRGKFSHMVEVIIGYLRENTIRPLLGSRTNTFTPFLLCLFFFILVNNLLGMIPLLDAWHLANPEDKKAHLSFIGGTATQSIYVTGVLALLSAIVINAAGISALGLGGYIKHLTAEAPVFVWPIIIPIEILGTIIKPVALAIRLFANMTAGHILVAVLLGFAGSGFVSDNPIIGFPVSIVSIIGTIAIYFLEIFVGFLQAYVFMFLTAVFISLLEHHGHDDEHAHEHSAAHA